MLPIILLQLPTVHYGCYSQDNLRCELYTIARTWLFFAISHLPIIMKSDHHQNNHLQQRLPISQLYTMGCKSMLGSKPCYAKCEFSRNCTTYLPMSSHRPLPTGSWCLPHQLAPVCPALPQESVSMGILDTLW